MFEILIMACTGLSCLTLGDPQAIAPFPSGEACTARLHELVPEIPARVARLTGVPPKGKIDFRAMCVSMDPPIVERALTWPTSAR